MPLRALTFALLLFALVVHAAAAAPTINNVSLRGLQAGGTTTLVLQGSDLQGEVKLLAPFAIAKQEAAPGGTGNQAQLAITLDTSIAPGIYAVRVTSPQGISQPLMLGVDRLPQQPLADKIEALPIALTGALGGGQIVKTSFAGKKEQPLVIDVEAQRIGANFKPVVRLYDSRGRQVAYSPPRHTIGGDARLAIKLPADDTYTIELHDLLYRAGGPGFFRLKVGELSYADFALPQAITRGTKGSIRFLSTNLAPETAAEIDATAATFRHERASASPASLFTGAQPGIVVSEGAEAVESATADGQKQTLSAVPCGVSGHISARGEEDQYLVPVTAGQKLRIDVGARRLGSLLDGVLIIRGAQGNELARADDQPGSPDPTLEFVVPAGVDKLLVCVRDMENRFGPEHVYHLALRDAAAPDVSAAIGVDTIHIPTGGTALVPVNVTRANYDGPLRLSLENAAGDIRLAGDEIPAGSSATLLTLSAQGGHPVQSIANLVIRSTDPNVPLARYVLAPAVTGAQRYQTHLRRELGVAITDAGPIDIDWALVESPHAFQGGRYPLPVKLARREGVMGDVRLRLVTTQPMPKKKIKENNQDKEVDDPDRALRLAEGQPVFKPDMKDATATLVVPGDLPTQSWPVVVVAELLSADGKSVVASAATSAHAIAPKAPFKLELTSTPQAEGKAGLGEPGKFTGKITREPGFTAPVAISLSGLPPEVKMVPQVMLGDGQTDFALPLTFEYGSKAGDYKGIKLSAFVAGSPNPSAAADVEIKITPGEKPQ